MNGNPLGKSLRLLVLTFAALQVVLRMYADPTTGGVLLQALVGGSAVCAVMYGVLRRRAMTAVRAIAFFVGARRRQGAKHT